MYCSIEPLTFTDEAGTAIDVSVHVSPTFAQRTAHGRTSDSQINESKADQQTAITLRFATMASAKEEPQRAALVFSAPVVKELISDIVRLPPNYVGVRRVRPSSSHVRNEFLSVTSCDTIGPLPPKKEVVYKITDANGNERRMNSQEKKKLKNKLKKERADEIKRLKKERAAESAAAAPSPTPHVLEQEMVSKPENSYCQLEVNDSSLEKKFADLSGARDGVPPSANDNRYHQLEVNKSSLQEEIADLRGDRDGVPPVMLSPPLLQQALRSGILAASSTCLPIKSEYPHAILDDDLANRWAKGLKLSMKSAEEARSKEDMRPMPYTLVPEVWTRLRPESLTAGADTHQSPPPQGTQATEMWSYVTVRLKRRQVDIDTDIVVSQIHRQSNLHISCGAKFGCDFLLYDGRRDERHAFAGLRIIERETLSHLPLPTPYDLTGFVRCLNTAGKLALLATVQHDEAGVAHIAVVDLALEKILSENKRKRKRQDATKNLTKHR